MSKLVSILIPAHNAGKWIGDTVVSALNQTWPEKEIVIVEDGSTDNTLAIARQFESRIVKVIAQENRGASAARNRALALAQGDYIQWLDADDLLAADKISQQLKKCDNGETTRILLSSAWGRFFFRYKKAAFIPHSLWQDLSPLEWLMTKFIDNVWVHPAAWLVSRNLTELSGLWDERLSFDDDGEYFSRVVAASERVAFVPEAKSYYRSGNVGSLSWGMSERALDSLFLSATLCIQHLLSLEDTEKTRAACVKLLQNRLAYFYPEKQELMKKMKDLSRDLGGDLVTPSESWKFAAMRRILGWKTAKKIKSLAWRAEVATNRNWDRALYILFDR